MLNRERFGIIQKVQWKINITVPPFSRFLNLYFFIYLGGLLCFYLDWDILGKLWGDRGNDRQQRAESWNQTQW